MWRVLIVENVKEVRDRIVSSCRLVQELRVVAAIDDGEQATRLSNVLKPDAIAISINLCAHDRFKVLENILAHSPTRILVYATGNKAYDLGLDRALQSGAMHVFTAAPSDDAVAAKLTRAITDLCVQDKPSKASAHTAPLGAPKPLGVTTKKSAPEPIRPLQLPLRIVGIGASTGGPAAIEYLLRKWARDFPLPIVVAQHMTTGFNKDLVRWLDTLGSLRVKLADDDEQVAPGIMYFAPDGTHISLADEYRVRLTVAKPDESEVPSVDRLFESLAKQLGAAAMGVLLTGMGEDGAKGLLTMTQSGARTVAQDRDTSLVYGMPSAAHKLGAAQLVLGLSDIADYLNDCARARRGKPK